MRYSLLIHPAAWAREHWLATTIFAAVCLWVSGCFIANVWIRHSSASFLKKLLWSLALLVPFFGWLMYGALFTVPDRLSTPNPGTGPVGQAPL